MFTTVFPPKLKGLQTNHFITHLIDVLLEEDVGGVGVKGGSGKKSNANAKSAFGGGGGGSSSICSVDDWTNTSGERLCTGVCTKKWSTGLVNFVLLL